MNEEPLGVEHLYSFRDVFEAVASTRSFEDLLDVILSTALRELGAEQGSLLLVQNDPNSGEILKMLASRGLPEDMVKRGYVPRRGSISEYVLREGKSLIINDAPKSSSYNSMSEDDAKGRAICSALCVPLTSRGTVLGTMNLNRLGQGNCQFTDKELHACFILAGQAAIVIEHKQLQDKLLQKERLAAVGETVAGVSHCVKNIMVGINGGIDLAEMGIADDNKELVKHGYDLLRQSSERLTNVVLDLLDYAKEREPKRKQFDVEQTIREVLAAIEPKAKNFNVSLSLSTDDSLVYEGDQNQIYRALLNLVTNAVEACLDVPPPRRKVQVMAAFTKRDDNLPAKEAFMLDRWLDIRVADSGPGIPEEAKDLVWELFYSMKGSLGTGIGLAATKKMVEEHHGIIRILSSDENGTTIQMLLPVGIR